MKVLVIGVDGLDPELVTRMGERLPFLSGAAHAADARMRSVFPPDSIPAWASIMTGLGEAEHGVFGHIDYLSQSTPDTSGGYADALRGRTFFDVASSQGRSVCVVNPFLAYPPWPVNGVMVSGPLALHAESLAAGTVGVRVPQESPILGGIEEFPSKHDLDAFIGRTRSDIGALGEYAREVLSAGEFDLGFVSFFQLDRVQHFLWRFTDPGDGDFVRGNPHVDAIEAFYEQIERECAALAAHAGAEAVVVVSDHGHGRRCERVFNVNELLRRADLVTTSVGKNPWLSAKYWTQRAKIGVLNVSWRLGLEEQAFALARRMPGKKALKTSSYLHDKGSNLAVASSIGGTNPFGGIDIYEERAAELGQSVDEVAERVLKLLRGAKDRKGRALVQWAARREELMSGEHLSAFPHVLFELLPEYGVGWDLFGALEGPNVMHRRISGGHKRDGYVGFVGATRVQSDEQPTVRDVAPTVLDLLGCEPLPQMRGSVIARR